MPLLHWKKQLQSVEEGRYVGNWVSGIGHDPTGTDVEAHVFCVACQPPAGEGGGADQLPDKGLFAGLGWLG